MNDTLLNLIAANIAFVGSHFAMSHPLRARLVRAFSTAAESMRIPFPAHL